MAAAVRRVVTGHDSEGKSVVLFDDEQSEVLWSSDSAPVDNSGDADTAVGRHLLEPPPTGSSFRLFEIPPQSRLEQYSEEELRRRYDEGFASIGGAHTRVDTSRHPGMHKTSTLDYVVVLKGELTLLLDHGEVTLKPFDVVVQRGTNHAWVNRGEEKAMCMAVLLGAEPE